MQGHIGCVNPSVQVMGFENKHAVISMVSTTRSLDIAYSDRGVCLQEWD